MQIVLPWLFGHWRKFLRHAQALNWCLFSIAPLRAFKYDTYSKRIIHSMVVNSALSLSQCTMGGPVNTGKPLECHWVTQCTLGYHWAIQSILQGTLEHHWKNLIETAPHWNDTGENLTIAAYIGTPLEGRSQPTHPQAHIVKQSSIHASLKGQDDGAWSSKWTGLCKFSY